MIRSVEIQFVKVNCDTLLVDFKFYFARIILRFHFWLLSCHISSFHSGFVLYWGFVHHPEIFHFRPFGSNPFFLQRQLTVSYYLDGLSVFSLSVKMQSYLQICSKITKIFFKTLITESSPKPVANFHVLLVIQYYRNGFFRFIFYHRFFTNEIATFPTNR